MDSNNNGSSLSIQSDSDIESVDSEYSNDTQDEVQPSPQQIQSAFRVLSLVDRSSFAKALQAMRDIIHLTDDQVEDFHRSRAAAKKNPYSKRKRGRNKGTKNKKGHRAGGNRYHAKHIKPLGWQKPLSFLFGKHKSDKGAAQLEQ